MDSFGDLRIQMVMDWVFVLALFPKIALFLLLFPPLLQCTCKLVIMSLVPPFLLCKPLLLLLLLVKKEKGETAQNLLIPLFRCINGF